MATPKYEIDDPEETFYNFDKENAHRDMVVKLYEKAANNKCQEMSHGGVTKRFIDGRVVEIMMPNTHEIYINSVNALYYTVEPVAKKTDKKTIQKMFADADKAEDGLSENYENQKTALIEKYSRGHPDTLQQRQNMLSSQLKALQDDYEKEQRHIADIRFLAISRVLHEHNWFGRVYRKMEL